MEISHIFQFLLGMVLLYYGADYLIDGSKAVASHFKIPTVIVGITLVAFGTSLPELIVSIMANLKDKPGMVVGNVVGSNIANIGLVLGAVAFYKPFKFEFGKIQKDLYYLLGITLMPVIFIYFGNLVSWEGGFLLIILVFYYRYLFNQDHIYEAEDSNHSNPEVMKLTAKIIFSIFALGFGSHYFIEGASGIAIALGVSSLVIGMSIVALGTSLPELAASFMAARKGEAGFAIGNIIGSNIINIVVVLGITILIRPIQIRFAEVWIQSLIMIILTLLLFFSLKFMGGITKLSALLMIIIYGVFIFLNFQPI